MRIQKRLLAIFLSVSLIMSLVPPIPAAETHKVPDLLKDMEPIVRASVVPLDENTGELTVTVSDIYGTYAETFVINKNSADIYHVDDYDVYIDTRDNIQIKACYIISYIGNPFFSITGAAADRVANTVSIKVSANKRAYLDIRILEDVVGDTDDWESGRLLDSGGAYIDEAVENEFVEVQVSSVLPEYFIVLARLVNTKGEDLCDEFMSIDNTRAHEEFMALTVYDFDPDTVVNLDEAEDNNFMATSKGVVIINAGENDRNILNTLWIEDNTYVFYNVGPEVSSLNIGDKVVVISDDDHDIFLIKVANITIDGSIVTIVAEDGNELPDFFDVIKVDKSEYADNMLLDMSEATDGVEFIADPADMPDDPDEEGSNDYEIESLPDSDVLFLFNLINVSKTASRGLNYKINPTNFTQLSCSLKVKLEGKIKLQYDLKVFGKDYYYAELSIKVETDLTVNVTQAKREIAISLGYIEVPLGVPGLNATTRLDIIVDCNIDNKGLGFTANAWVKGGFVVERGNSHLINEKGSSLVITKAGNFSISIGPQVSPGISFLGGVLSGAINLFAGLDFHGTEHTNTSAAQGHSKHDCDRWVDGSLDLVAKISISFKLFWGWLANVKYDLAEARAVLFHFHASLQNPSTSFFGGRPRTITGTLGDCPNVSYRTTIYLKDTAENVVDGTLIQQVRLIRTGSSVPYNYFRTGKIEGFLVPGTYTAIVSANGYTFPDTIFTVYSPNQTINIIAKPVPVTGVSITPSVRNIILGYTATLDLVFTPWNATNRAVTWSSSDTSVATVNSSGAVTAKSVGPATITVKTADGGRTGTCNVTVLPFFPVTGIDITGVPKTILERVPLTLTGAIAFPNNASDQIITWSIAPAGNTAGGTIGGVDGNILYTTKPGEVIVQARVANGSAAGVAYVQNFTVTVTPFIAVTDIVAPTTTVAGMPLKLGTVVPVNASFQAAIWSVLPEGNTAGGIIRGVDGNILYTTKTGAVSIAASIHNGSDIGKTYTKTFTVNVIPFVAVTAIKDVPVDVTAGTPLTLTGTLVPANASSTITWSVLPEGNTAGATIRNGNILDTMASGSVVVRGTVAGEISFFSEVSAGGEHTAALTADGSLWTWGRNTWGQLGNGSSGTRGVPPAQVGADRNWAAVSAGENYTVALKTDGSLWAWGLNDNGQLGNSSYTDSYIPERIGTETDWALVSAGYSHTAALKTDGSLWAWGYNWYGQLGDDGIGNKYIPVRIGTETDWVAVSTGENYTVALKTDGSLWVWGDNWYSQLGLGSIRGQIRVPVRVGTETDWAAISTGKDHSVALKTDGSLWEWGYLNKSYSPLRAPIRIGTETDWVAVSAGYSHAIALKDDGSLWAWGADYHGQLGLGSNMEQIHVPARVGTETDWSAISADGAHTAALKDDGSLWTFGLNNYGQLGSDTLGDRAVPARVFLPYTQDFTITSTMNNVVSAADLHQQVGWYYSAIADVSITIERDLALSKTITIPANAAGKTVTIRSADPKNPVTLTRRVAGDLFFVSSGAKLILENIIIDGDKTVYPTNTSSLVYVYGGEFTLAEGAVLRNNRADHGGGVYVDDRGKFTMTGGEISGNTAISGGGVFINFASGITFTMTGGKISGNNATVGSGGGGVFVSIGEFTLGGTAVISGNTADNVYLPDRYITLSANTPPYHGMEVWVSTNNPDGVVVNSGANKGDEAYFYSDEFGKAVVYDNGQLVILVPPIVPINDFAGLQTAISLFAFAKSDMTIAVADSFPFPGADSLTIPESTYGATLTIRSADPQSPVTLTRGVADAMFRVSNGAKLVLENIIIDGNKAVYPTNTSSLVNVFSGGAFTLAEGAVLRNNRADYGGGVRVDGGAFTMTGGEISGNTATSGGGVYVYIGEFTVTGGEITNNTASSSGGGTYIDDGALILGGAAVINGNMADNVYLSNGMYIALSTIVPPKEGMIVGVQTGTPSGVIVNSGAKAGDEAYFNADESGYTVDFDSGQLLITVSPTASANSFAGLQTAIGNFASARNDMVITVTEGFSITTAGGLTIPANDYGKTLTIKGIGIPTTTLTRSIDGALFTVSSGARLLLENIIIDGNKTVYSTNTAPLVNVYSGGEFTLAEGAVLRNNRADSGGGVNVSGSGIFTMTGGEISGNAAYSGGGVNVSNGGIFTMTGGEISGNSVDADGGGVHTHGGVTLGGAAIISGNNADGNSGGVYVDYLGNFTLGGAADISGNTADGDGGGVYVYYRGKFTMEGGKINSNTAGSGSGVYVYDGGEFTLGGTADISGNTTGNVYLDDGDYITISTTVSPASGMNVGIQTATPSGVIVDSDASAGHAAYFKADESGKAVVFHNGQLLITISGTAISASALTPFGSLQTPYAQPAAQTVTITNIGAVPVTLTQPVSTDYEIGALSTLTLAAYGSTASFTVRPKPNLPGGTTYITYNETIAITGTGGAVANVVASFTVTVADQPDVYVSEFGQLQAAISDYEENAVGGLVIKVTNGFSITSGLTIPANAVGALTITSADPQSPVTLKRSEDAGEGGLFTVSPGARLILENIIVDGMKDPDTGSDAQATLVYVEGAFEMGTGALLKNNQGGGVRVIGSDEFTGEFTMRGGEISGNIAPYGQTSGGVDVIGGVFSMSGGKISGNTVNSAYEGHGGGVRVFDGVFTMSGGEISGNTANLYGGGVYVARSKFTMSGGKISGNAAEQGGGVYADNEGEFTITGGEISGNTAEYGGGVNISFSTLNMSDGEISGNTGGGVYVSPYSKFTFGGTAVISDNNTDYGGGGVTSEGEFTMSGGKIRGNTATDSNGGGVLANGIFTMTGGEISGNTSYLRGGGVFIHDDGGFTLGGKAVINGNKNNSSANSNVYLLNNKFIELGTGADAPASGMNVGVQAQTSSGVIVDSGASAGHVTYFYADESGKSVVYEDGKLAIR